MSTPTVYQIKVTLLGSSPPIWRRFLVNGTTRLHRVHDVLQAVMGWQDYHLHMFTINGQIYGDPEDDEFGDLGTQDEAKVKLNELITREGSSFRYEYDFGDCWEHDLVVEKILPVEKKLRSPRCIAGERACPPEDVGGVGGYQRFLQAIADPEHLEHDEYLTWVGGKFDPEHFDLKEANFRLRHPYRPEYDYPIPALDEQVLNRITGWSQSLSQEEIAFAERLAARRDMVTLLNYIRDNRPQGTQATGNFTLKAVREVCAQFVHPPALEGTIGNYHYQVRSEADVWPLFFLHMLAAIGNLAAGGQGRVWRLTATGETFLNSSPPWQVGIMLAIWWHRMDWIMAWPVEGLSRGLPFGFRRIVRDGLLTLKPGQFTPFEQVADDLIATTGLTWPSDDQTFAPYALRTVIRRLVVNPLENLGCVEGEYRLRDIDGWQSKELIRLRLTPLGKSLLEAIE